MQRDLQITPRRLEYTREKEGELFTSLMTIANRKQEEMKDMIVETLGSMKEQLLEDAANLEFTGQWWRTRWDQDQDQEELRASEVLASSPLLPYVSTLNWSRVDSASLSHLADVIVTTNGDPVTSKEIKSCIHQIQDLIVVRLNQAVANKLTSSVDYLRESFVGTLERCLSSLEKSHIESSVHNITSNHLKQVSGGEDPLRSRPIGDLRGFFNPPFVVWCSY